MRYQQLMSFANHRQLLFRIFYDLVLIGFVSFAPWPVTAIAALAGLFLFPNFLELVVVGLSIDLLYATPTARFFDFQFVVTLFSIISMVSYSVLRRFVRFSRP